jgi:broad specificity phosphatase PhoE
LPILWNLEVNRSRRRLLQLAPLILAGGWARAARADEATWRQVGAGACAILLRHARTTPGIGDPPAFRLEDCSTQRNLSDAGRAQARRFGAEFERRGIRIDEVRSSRWCRCLDTARLAFPGLEVQPLEALDSFFTDGSAGGTRTAALRDHLRALPATRRVVLVTHMVNITALTGESPAMGEALVVRTGGAGAGEVLGRLWID